MNKFIPFAALFLFLILTSCSNGLVDTWNIDKYEIIREDGKDSSHSNIGTVTFEKEGKGHTNYRIIEKDLDNKSSFEWMEKDSSVLIKSLKSSGESIFTKAWIEVESGSKKKVWKSTDGQHEIQVLVLSRK